MIMDAKEIYDILTTNPYFHILDPKNFNIVNNTLIIKVKKDVDYFDIDELFIQRLKETFECSRCMFVEIKSWNAREFHLTK